MKENKSVKSFGELPTLGHEETRKEEPHSATEGPSWTKLGLSEATTQRPPEGAGGIVDDGRTDGARRWKAGETILDRYVVEGELGQGGMGVVYGCLDRVGGVRVAVKCLPPELGHNSVEMEEVRENFQLVYGLSHPNIAGVRQLERDGKGEYYLVMELAAGESLRRWLRGKWKAGGVSLAEAAGVLRQVAAALDFAHRRKIVHRDVKPGNVMIDGKGEVKVLDFGLAAQIRTSLSRASHAYRGTSGTGPYMAPEQWRAQPQDAKTDQYALGVMAYEMLAGRLPFENPELAVLKDAVLNGEVAAIPGVPEGAMAAIRRAMAKRAEERFGSCGEFVEALEGEREDRPTARPGQNPDAATAGGQGGAGAGGRRKARGRTLMGWVVALALAGAVGVWWKGSGGRAGGKWEEGKGNAVEETARPEDSPHQQTAEEAEAEKKAEEERLAAEKEAEEEAARMEEERIRAQREEEIRQKNEELEETVYRLAPLAKTKAENAERMGYDRGEGFGERLDAVKEKLGQGETAVKGRNFGKAKEYFEASMAAADWCAENAPLRQAAKSAGAAAGAAKKKAEALDGERLALRSYKRASEKAAEGKEAFGSARFKEATAAWNAAVEGYGQAEQEARAAKVEQGLVAARGAELRNAWEECIAAAEGVLALEAGNAEAKRLKAEAAGKLKPSILLKATVGGREVAATVTEGLNQSGWKTPVPVPLERGGNYAFALEYEADGKKYAGRRTVEAKARGVTEAVVALEEVKEEEAGRTKTITLPGGATMEMVWCPPGSFTMGSPPNETGRDNDETQHKVTLTEGFWMAKYEVMQKQWESVMGNNPSNFKGDELPVECVTWTEAKEFCEKAGHGLRLPTEAEWEYACRAGSKTAYFWGNALNGDRANCDGNYPCGTTVKGPYKQKTTPVGSYDHNAWGLYDMHGNVWEWCADTYKEDLGTQSVTNPRVDGAAGSYRVLRGGSWFDYAKNCRSANRFSYDPAGRILNYGFRPCCSAGQP